MPKAEAGALANATVKLDIVYVGVDKDDLAILRTLADVAGGNAILLQEPEEEEEPGKPVELVPSEGAAADEEHVIDIKPKGQETPEENGVKGVISKIKEKVW